MRTFRPLCLMLSLLACSTPIYAQRAWNMQPVQRLGGATGLVEHHGDKLFTATGSLLRIWNAADPAEPALLDSHSLPTTILSIAADGNYVYLTLDPQGRNAPSLVTVSYQSTGNLLRAGQLTNTDWPYGIFDIAVEGNTLYSSGQGGVVTFDVTNRATPTILGSEPAAAYCNRGVYSEGYVYSRSYDGKLYITDVRDPLQPALAFIYSLSPADSIQDVAVAGNHAYLGLYNERMAVLDVANPASPSLVRTVAGAGGATLPRIDSGRLYLPVGYRRLATYSLANPGDPQLLGEVTTTFDTNDLAVSGDAGFVAAGTNGVAVLDYSDPGAPTPGTPLEFQLPLVTQVGRVGSVTVATRGDMGVSVLGGAPGLVREDATVAIPGVFAERFAARGNRAYIFGTLAGGIPMVDFAVPAAPTLATAIPFAGQARRGAIGGDVLAVGGDSNVVTFFDLSGESASQIGTVTLDAGAAVRNLFFAPDGHVWVAAGTAGLYELSTSPTPAVARHLPVDRLEALDVFVRDNRAYLARGSAGLEVLDISGGGFVKLDQTSEPAAAIAPADATSIYVSQGAYDGIVQRLDTRGDRVEQLGYFQAPAAPDSIHSSDGVLWMAARSSGLVLAKPFADPAPNRPPARQRPLSPVDGATGVELTPVLARTPFSDPDAPGTPAGSPGGGYFYVLDGAESVVVVAYSAEDSFHVPAGQLQPNTTYYWYATQSDSSGDPETSVPLGTGFSKFTTGDGTPFVNTPPVANAGPASRIVAPGTTVQLDGSGSTDGEGNVLTYSWFQSQGTVVALTNRNSAVASFVAPEVPAITTLSFGLIVSDGRVASSASASVIVDHPPAAPTFLRPTAAQQIAYTDMLQLSPFSDADAGDSASAVRWQIAAGADVNFAAPVLDDIAGSGASRAVPDTLTMGAPYLVRAAYADSQGVYGPFSAPVAFSVSTFLGKDTWIVE